MAQTIPRELSHLMALNAEYGVLVCLGSGCSRAVSPAGFAAHVRRMHKVPKDIWQRVAQYVKECPFEYDHSDVQLPADGLAPQPIVKVVDGLRCRLCVLKTQSRGAMKKHGNKEHLLTRVSDDELFEPVKLQSWFWNGKERYWVVDNSQGNAYERHLDRAGVEGADEVQGDLNSGGSREDSLGEIDESIVREIEDWKAEVRGRQLRALQDVPATEKDSWLQYTAWTRVLSQSKHDLVKTHQFARKPDADESDLGRVLRAWSRILERCLNTLAATDQKDTLKWWASPKNEAISQRPFELPQSSKVIHRYSAIWEGLICYMMRTGPIDDWEDDTETGVKYTQGQWKAINRMRQYLQWPQSPVADEAESQGQDLKLTNMLMVLCMLVVMQDTSKISLYESPMMHYLAVRGIDEQGKTLRPALLYTGILAGMLWMNRLIMLEVAVPLEPWPALKLKSRDEIDSVPDRIHDLRQQHLCEGSFSPTASILSQLAMGKKFNKLHLSPSNIHWSGDEQTIFYEGKGVSLSKIQGMCHAMIGELQAEMKELAFETELPSIDLAKIVDSMSGSQGFRRQGYCFTEHVANRELTGTGYQHLLKLAQRGAGQWRLLQRGRKSLAMEWVDSQVKSYLTRERQFLQKLMVCMHTTAGQPARGPEIGCIKIQNGTCSARNIYVINALVCFLTTYDKARKRRGNTEHIVRFLPPDLSQVVVQYLVFISPFARALPLDRRESEYLFGDMRGPWAGEELSRALSRITEKHLGVRLTVIGWRHVAIGIATRHLARASRAWEKDDDENEEDADEEFAEGDDEDELALDTFRHVIIRQCGHGRRVAQQHYAVDGAFLHRLGPELISAFEQASLAWHRLWKLDGGSQVTSQSMTTGQSHRREASQQLTKQPGKRGRNENAMKRALTGLQRIYHDVNAKPRSEGQASALELVHGPSPTVPLIIVLPTSSGKSVLFFSVAAMTVQQTVIIVVPFTELVNDIVIRGQAAGLQCEQWLDERSGKELPQLMVVSADRAMKGEFLHYAKGLELSGHLAHVFFDECHVAFTDTSYRERLRELWALRYLACPFTGLTATLMVPLEGVLKERLSIPNATIFRRSAARPTIRYCVIDTATEMPSTVGIAFVKKLPLPSHKRGVVYVRSYVTGKVVSEALQCRFYKARADDKGEILCQWAGEAGGWIVATGALGTGINIEGITHVVHIDQPYGLTSFAQQSGRGGRNGEVSNSIIIARVESNSGWKRKEILTEYSVEAIDEEAMTAFMQSKTCRRQVLSRYFDEAGGGAIDCASTDSVFCDRCAVQHREVSSSGRTDMEMPAGARHQWAEQQFVADQLRQSQESYEVMICVMGQLQGQCIYCALTEEGISMEKGKCHSYNECKDASATGCGMAAFKRWRCDIDFRQSKHCWRCGLSQRICRRLEGSTAETDPTSAASIATLMKECEYENIMLPTMFILQQKWQHLEKIVISIGFQGDFHSDDLWEWLSAPTEGFGREWESNWMEAWAVICETYAEMKAH